MSEKKFNPIPERWRRPLGEAGKTVALGCLKTIAIPLGLLLATTAGYFIIQEAGIRYNSGGQNPPPTPAGFNQPQSPPVSP